MPLRWVLSPVVSPAPGARFAKVGLLVDRGQPPVAGVDDEGNPTLIPKTYKYSAVISDGLPGQENDWCLCCVRFVDPSEMDSDPEIVSLFEAGADYEDGQSFLASTPRALGWSSGKAARVLARVRTRNPGASLDEDSPLWQWCREVARAVRPDFAGPLGTWVQ